MRGVGDLTAQTVVVRRLVKPALQRIEESAPARFTQAHGRAVGLDLALPQHAGIEHPQHRGLRDAGSRGLEEIEGERGASVTKSVQEAGEDIEPCGRERYAEGAGPDVGGRNSNGNDAASAGLRRGRDGIVKRICIDKDVRRTENVARSAAGTPRSRLRRAGVVRGAAWFVVRRREGASGAGSVGRGCPIVRVRSPTCCDQVDGVNNAAGWYVPCTYSYVCTILNVLSSCPIIMATPAGAAMNRWTVPAAP